MEFQFCYLLHKLQNSNQGGIMKNFIAIILILSIQSVLADPMTCENGSTSASVINGFFPVNDNLSCPRYEGACVNAHCPVAIPMYCEKGKPLFVIVGYSKYDETTSCPIFKGACVDQQACPSVAPMYCSEGQPVVITRDFYQIDENLACPILEGACVDYSLCPQY